MLSPKYAAHFAFCSRHGTATSPCSFLYRFLRCFNNNCISIISCNNYIVSYVLKAMMCIKFRITHCMC